VFPPITLTRPDWQIVAPTDEAFERIQGDWEQYDEDTIKAIIKYHILRKEVKTKSVPNGDTVAVSTLLDSPTFANITGGQQVLLTKQPGDEIVITSGFATRGTIVEEDIPFTYGTIQVIDSVMRIPLSLAPTARDAYKDLISFLGALYNLDLYEEFNNLKNVTMFIPKFTAFQQLAGRFENVDRAAFRHILRYHVIPGRVIHAWELVNGTTLPTYSQGKKGVTDNVTVTRNGNHIYINSAQLLQTDMLISNGVVHMVDNVLNPGNQSALPDLRPEVRSQTPVITPTGATSTGIRVPTPWTSDLPCTRDCPEPEPTDYPTSTSTTRRPAVTKNFAPAQFTGLTGSGLGLAALGALVVL